MKRLFSILPGLLLIGIAGYFGYQQWQQRQASRPDYDNPQASQKLTLSPKPYSVEAEVLKVESGDTISVRLKGTVESVRLCGINAPKLDQPVGKESRDHLQSLISKANNRAILYVSDTDRSGRKVAEIFVASPTPQQPEQEKFLNEEQLNQGFAQVYKQYVDRCPNGNGLVAAEKK